MGQIWTEQAKFQSWLDVELAVCEANCKLGRLPSEAMQQIHGKLNIDKVDETMYVIKESIGNRNK